MPSRLTAVVSAVVLALVGVGLSVPFGARAGAGTPAPQDLPALWLDLGSTPTAAETQYAATHYRVAVLNPWDTTALHAMKAINPSMIVLEYKDLMSTRSYSGAYDNATGQDASVLPTGVGYGYASTKHPNWFAKSAKGRRISWREYPGTWQMAVWNTGYQRDWVTDVAQSVMSDEWNGVFADNATSTLKYLAPRVSLRRHTNAAVEAGNLALIRRLAAALSGSGKIVVPNVTDARLTPRMWPKFGVGGGAFDEQFLHFGNNPRKGYVGNWRVGGWTAQTSEMRAPGLTLVHTNGLSRRIVLYGYSSFLIAGGGRGAFSATLNGDYQQMPLLLTQQLWAPGSPTAAARKVGTAWVRPFANVFAAVNPSDRSTTTVRLPRGLVNADGTAAPASIKLTPHDSVIYQVASREHATSASAAATPSPTTAGK